MRSILILSLLLVSYTLANQIKLETTELRLIAFSESHREWMAMEEVEKLSVNKIQFMDITDSPAAPIKSTNAPVPDPIPEQPFHKEYIGRLLPELRANNIADTITTLQAYFTRYYTSTTGRDSALWIYENFREIAKERPDITVELFNHTWIQPSVIARIPGIGPNADELVIIGAHEDSVGSSTTGRSPGADDDASGVATITEAFRVLVEAGYVPDRTVEFHAYAAEEGGLRGSQAIAQAYLARKAEVMSMMQFDMTGYSRAGGGGPIGVITDFTNANLTTFLRVLIGNYSTLPWQNSNCGYACSDHGSWTSAGYRAAFPFEAPYGQHSGSIHSANDLLTTLNINRCVEFGKLALAYVVELAGRA